MAKARSEPIADKAVPLVELPADPEPQAEAAPLALPQGMVAALERQSHSLLSAGRHADHALVSQIAVAAGALKQQTAIAHGRLGGELGDIINRLHSML